MVRLVDDHSMLSMATNGMVPMPPLAVRFRSIGTAVSRNPDGEAGRTYRESRRPAVAGACRLSDVPMRPLGRAAADPASSRSRIRTRFMNWPSERPRRQTGHCRSSRVTLSQAHARAVTRVACLLDATWPSRRCGTMSGSTWSPSIDAKRR